MNESEALNQGLIPHGSIRTSLRMRTKYDPKWIQISELARLTGIHYDTIARWAGEGKIQSRRCECGHGRFIKVKPFVDYALDNYRYKMNDRSGKWWEAWEIQGETPEGRTKNAIKVKKCKMMKQVSE